MKYTIKFFGTLLLLLILPFVSHNKLYAITYFSDDFQNGTLDKWVQNIGNVGDTSSWFVSNNVLHSSVTKGKFSYLYAKTTNLPKNYIFSADVKNISGVDQQFVFRVSDNEEEYYLVDYRYNDSGWYWDNNNIKVIRGYSDGQKLLGIYPDNLIPRSFDITQGINHKIQIIIKDNNIKAYFDDNLAIDVGDTDVPLSGTGFGLMTWGGDFGGISENIYENIQIYDPEPVTRNKVIILPGLGASWNPEAILLGSTAPSYQWAMTPFVKNYDTLISAMRSNALIENEDFYVWNYDWRKPLSQIVNDFNDYVNSLNLEAEQKVDLVGHSLGGLVARVWTQDHPTLVNQIVTLGSPNFGSVKAYEAWNGVKISDNLDVASVALNVLLQLQKKNNDTIVQTLRNYVPVIFDLSPTFSFLKRNGSNVASKASPYLVAKNNTVSVINDKLSTISGIGVSTKEWINLGNRSLFDKVLGIWEDGRPLSYVNGGGDGTVLKKSALISGAENMEFSSDHGAVVDKSINWILQKLDLGVTINVATTYPQKQAVFYLSSPATMTVNCGEIERSEVDGWIVIENQEIENCQVSLTGKDNGGTYHLVVGGDNDWQYFEGEIANEQSINIIINEVESYWQMLKRDLVSLGAVKAVVAVEQKNIITVADEYFKFRSSVKNFKYGEEILENIRFILNTKSVSVLEINRTYLKAVASKSLVETNLRLLARRRISPKYSAALNYEQANILMDKGKNYAANYLANRLYGIVWK